jgi:hypothetical protein
VGQARSIDLLWCHGVAVLLAVVRLPIADCSAASRGFCHVARRYLGDFTLSETLLTVLSRAVITCTLIVIDQCPAIMRWSSIDIRHNIPTSSSKDPCHIFATQETHLYHIQLFICVSVTVQPRRIGFAVRLSAVVTRANCVRES